MFAALLKYWRGHRGVSQLNLALDAGVSARHVSFLESGRAQPSEPMILRLLEALDVPLRDRNETLRAAGFQARYPEPALAEIPPAVEDAIARMLAQQEPYPLTVISPEANVLRSNRAAQSLFARFIAEADAPMGWGQAPRNMYRLIFDPRLMRPFIANWPSVARQMLVRLHRESLQRRGDERLEALARQVLAFPGVPRGWYSPALADDLDPVFTVHLRRGEVALAFFTTVTVFPSARVVTLDELRLESSFPLDEATRRHCEAEAAAERRG